MAFDDIIGKTMKTVKVSTTPIISVKEARAVIKQAMRDDPQFRYGYVANAAMLLVDRYNVDAGTANRVAEEIVRLFFDIE